MLKTSGFILRKNNYREYDRIYTVYTADYGKVSLLARGARRIKSKLAPNLENFGEVRIDFANGKIFNHLAGVNVVSLNKGLINDGEKIAFVSDCFYLLDRFIKPEEGDGRIYELLKETFGAINNVIASPEGAWQSRGSRDCGACPERSEGISPRNDTYVKIKIYFFWRLVDFLGYRPQLDECALCGKAIGNRQPAVSNKKLKFDITDNIMICSICVGDGLFIQENTLENLRKIFQSDLTEFLKIELDNQLVAITEKAKQIKLSEL